MSPVSGGPGGQGGGFDLADIPADAAASVASLRSLGTSAGQALSVADADARYPAQATTTALDGRVDVLEAGGVGSAAIELARHAAVGPMVGIPASGRSSSLGSNATLTAADGSGVTYISRHVARGAGALLRCWWGDHVAVVPATDTGDGAGANDLTVAAEVRIGTDVYPCYFKGVSTTTVHPNEVVGCDAIGAAWADGQVIEVRTFVTVTAGQKIPRGLYLSTANGEGSVAGSALGVASPTLGSGYGYTPLALTAGRSSATRTIGLLGDSILNGALAAGSYDSSGGWGARLCETEGLPHVNVSWHSQQAQYWRGQVRARRMALLTGCTEVVLALGRNDVTNSRTLAQMQADLVEIATALKRFGALRVIGATVTPSTTGSWSTLAGQTVTANDQARLDLNTWLRTVPAPFDAVLDVAAAVEAPTAPGKWDVSGGALTSDGVHPLSGTVHQRIATALDL